MEETFYLVPIKYVEMEEMIMFPNLYKEDKYQSIKILNKKKYNSKLLRKRNSLNCKCISQTFRFQQPKTL